MNWIKIFLENKGHGKPKACVRLHTYAYAYFKPMYAGVPETVKVKFFCIKVKVQNEYHIV